MSEVKLNQIIAVEKGEKSRHNSIITQAHRLSDAPQIFNGLHKVYEPKDEEGENFPEESVKVQENLNNVINEVAESLADLFDVTATKDFGNTIAKADIKVGDTVIVKDAPPTFLLYLEKQLNDIKTYVEKLPELDPAETWARDEDSGMFKSGARQTHKTRKVEKPIVLYAATEKHPAQTQLVVSDEIIGYWTTTKLSTCISATRKKEMLDKIAVLMRAVKFAREEANNTSVERKEIGKDICNFIFG